MKHYRILEKKGENKQYIIQYLQKLFFGLYFWKKVKILNAAGEKITYSKYDEALNSVKSIIKQQDYETPELGYHYIDAYKIFKFRDNNKQLNQDTSITTTSTINVPKKADIRKVNKSVFVPK